MTDPHATADPSDVHHDDATDHGDGHGHDDHAHPAGALGPIDWPMWLTGALGVIVALVMTACFVVASGYTFAG